MSSDEISKEQNDTLDSLPQCWNDRRLLKHDPLKEMFMQLGYHNDTGHTLDLSAIIKSNIKNANAETFCKAFVRWGLVIFEREPDELGTYIPSAEEIVTNPMYWKLFVDVIDKLRSNSTQAEEQARKAVNLFRKSLGYLVDLPGPHPMPNDYCKLSIYKTHLLAPDLKLIDEINVASKIFMQLIPEDEVSSTKVFDHRRSGRTARPPQPPRCGTVSNQQKLDPKKPKKKKAQTKQTLGVKEARASKNDERIASVNSLSSDFNDYTNPTNDLEDVRLIASRSLGTQAGIVSHATYDPVHDAHENPHTTTTHDMVQPAHPQVETMSCMSLPPSIPSQTLSSSGKRKGGSKRIRLICSECRRGKIGCNRERPKCANCVLRGKECRYDTEQNRQVDNFADSIVITRTRTTVEGESVSAQKRKRPIGSVDIQTGAPDSDSGSTKKRRRSKRATIASLGFAISTPPAAGELGASEESTFTCRLTGRPKDESQIWESSEETLVDDENGGKESSSKNYSPELLKKMELSVDSTRPHVYLPKPALPKGIRPKLWAMSRQALCETSSWFRCYHGGVYFSDGKVYGYLLGGYSSQRDVFCHGGRLIISHGGGKSLEGSIGQRDQDSSVQSLLYNYENQLPLVLLADNKYVHFPFDLERVMYVVLGYYWIVDAWGEIDVIESDGKLETRIRYKFAFQYCEGQGTPWWLEKTETDPRLKQTFEKSPLNEGCLVELPLVNQGYMASVCSHCDRSSPRPYTQGWMCFNPDCTDFCKIGSEEAFVLDYDEKFLALRPDPGFGSMDISIPSPLEESANVSKADSFYSTMGWQCLSCGQLCPREKWECWECPDCKISFPNDYKATLPIRRIQDIRRELPFAGRGTYSIYHINKGSGISVTRQIWSTPCGTESGLEYIFELPENQGHVHLLRGNAVVNRQANRLFIQYQEEARDKSFLRRYPLRSHHARGRMLTNYFSHNAGAPYKYAVSTNDTVPFDQAPDSVNSALRLISDRVSTRNFKEFSHFNEILTAAYMEEQKMSYHSDDEKGLGPIVASLSLGSTAHMHFRQHKALTTTNPEYQFSLVLRHGDVLAMDGALIQKHYEHSVVPLGFRIAATARYIDLTPGL